MKQVVFSLLLSIFFLPAFATRAADLLQENTRDTIKIKKILKEISNDNVFNMDNGTSLRPAPYEQLLREGSTYDFLKIAMDNSNPVVRLYAFRAVAEKMDNLPADLVLKFKSDTALVSVLTNGKVTKMPVNEVANGFLK